MRWDKKAPEGLACSFTCRPSGIISAELNVYHKTNQPQASTLLVLLTKNPAVTARVWRLHALLVGFELCIQFYCRDGVANMRSPPSLPPECTMDGLDT